MRKLTAAIISSLILIFSIVGFANANALTIEAENGKILPPAGLGFELNGQFSIHQTVNQNNPMAYEAQLSYGITPAITIAGNFKSDFQKGSSPQTTVKALFSPSQTGNGYTLYTDYDLTQSKIADYGISLWYDSKYLFTFANLESRAATSVKPTSLVLTPGANLRVGSKIRIAGEVELQTENWQSQELRFGVNYNLSPKISAKLGFSTTTGTQPDRVYQTGLSVNL